MIGASKQGKWKRFVPISAAFVMTVITGMIIYMSGEPLSVETILRYTPKNVFFAALVLLFFCALKSLTVVVPLSVLYLASGLLFPPVPAVLVSTAGLFIAITVPYWVGRYSGENTIDSLYEKYPKIYSIMKCQGNNTFFTCFITRMVGFLLGDILSLYFGVCKIPYVVYLGAGICGSLLSIITTTLLGTKLRNLFSTEFLSVLLLRILISVAAIILNVILKRKRWAQ